MYDVNFHPRQEVVNDKIARIVANTISELSKLSKEENIEAKSLAEQFSGVFNLMMNVYTEGSVTKN